ncbi:hypothetical protein [Nocardiopsis dassonvillei]|uniref:hypothetical protein n=1 Tax=Nocardiopsis dassonvillei TaxID=2014 RepID=UPI0036290EB5
MTTDNTLESGPTTEPMPTVAAVSHSAASTRQVGAVLAASRATTRLLTEHPELGPGLHRALQGDDGHMSFHYAAVAGDETISAWGSPDGVHATWQSILVGAASETTYVDRDVQVERDQPALLVQDKVVTVRGYLDAVPVTVIMTAAGLPDRRP